MTHERGPDDDLANSGTRRLPNDESVEDVLKELEDNDRILRDAGHYPGEFHDTGNDLLTQSQWSNETERKDWEQTAEALQDALGAIGLYRADELSAEALSQIDPEVLRQLTPHIAESLFFVASRRTTKWLGNEPIQPEALISYAEMLIRNGHNLEKIQLLQRQSSLARLFKQNLDESQLLKLLVGSPAAQQCINRLDYFLFEEPRLTDYVKELISNEDLDNPWDVQSIVREAQMKLKVMLNEINDKRAIDENAGRMDLIYEQKCERTVHRIGSTISIGNMILRDTEGMFPGEDIPDTDYPKSE